MDSLWLLYRKHRTPGVDPLTDDPQNVDTNQGTKICQCHPSKPRRQFARWATRTINIPLLSGGVNPFEQYQSKWSISPSRVEKDKNNKNIPMKLTDSSPLKIDGWKTILLFLGRLPLVNQVTIFNVLLTKWTTTQTTPYKWPFHITYHKCWCTSRNPWRKISFCNNDCKQRDRGFLKRSSSFFWDVRTKKWIWFPFHSIADMS